MLAALAVLDLAAFVLFAARVSRRGRSAPWYDQAAAAVSLLLLLVLLGAAFSQE